jgi:hypothetical protein
MTGNKSCPVNLLDMHAVYTDGNMEIIAKTILIDISKTPSIMENVFVRADCSPEEILIYTYLFKEFCDIFAWS